MSSLALPITVQGMGLTAASPTSDPVKPSSYMICPINSPQSTVAETPETKPMAYPALGKFDLHSNFKERTPVWGPKAAPHSPFAVSTEAPESPCVFGLDKSGSNHSRKSERMSEIIYEEINAIPELIQKLPEASSRASAIPETPRNKTGTTPTKTSARQNMKAQADRTGSYVEITYLRKCGSEETFTICVHWLDFLSEALRRARAPKSPSTQQAEPYRWISNFNALHYAASKNNLKLAEFLLEAPECENFFRSFVHQVDDFYEKPLDHLCNAKGVVPKSKQVFADFLLKYMNEFPADPACEREILYQDIKLHGPLHLRENKNDAGDMSNVAGEGGIDLSNVASGESGVDLTNIMTSYEVENVLPSDMRKNFKVVQKSGFDNFTGSWTKGESPLHWAAARGKVDVCRMLILSLKGDPEAEDDKGRSAIKCAKIKKHHALAKMLHSLDFPIERDAEIKKKKDEARKNPTVAPTLKRVVGA